VCVPSLVLQCRQVPQCRQQERVPVAHPYARCIRMSPPAVKGRLAGTKAASILVSALRARQPTNACRPACRHPCRGPACRPCPRPRRRSQVKEALPEEPTPGQPDTAVHRRRQPEHGASAGGLLGEGAPWLLPEGSARPEAIRPRAGGLLERCGAGPAPHGEFLPWRGSSSVSSTHLPSFFPWRAPSSTAEWKWTPP
jgi:hypothetical protein